MIRIGYDLFSIHKEDIYFFLQFIKKKKLRLLHLRHQDDMYYAYIPTYQRYTLKTFDKPLYYHQTIGMLKYVLFLSKQYLNIIGVVCFMASVIACSHFIFDIQIIGTLPKVNQSLKRELKEYDIQKYSTLKSYEQLNDILSGLKTIYKNDVEYMNVYQIGSVFHVEYTKRKQDVLEKDDYRNLYAKKDGLIAYLDVDSGMIQVKPNDYVKKGDLLVENTFQSTSNETKITAVKGEVYAYTFNQYEASVPNKNQDQGDAFYHLLLNIRAKLPTDAIIDKENVLQISKTRSKITLKMHYTLLENIAIKGEKDEESR